MRLGTIFAGLLLLAVTASSFSADAQGRRNNDRDRNGDRDSKWELLGCENVGRRADWDEIKVGRREGRFSAIRLEARGNDVSILDLRVIYANGDPDNISVGTDIREGDQTRPFDLRGRDRSIDRIEVVSKKDFKGRGRGRAQVCVFGRSADNDRRSDDRRSDRGDNWEELGCQSVGFLGDRDVIKVGRREGRFKAIKLNVSGNAVEILDLKVIYTNGEPDNIQVRSEIRQGGETRPLDLNGRERSIDRVELVYRARANFRGKAKVCVTGLQ